MAQTSWRPSADGPIVGLDVLVALGDDTEGTTGSLDGTTEPFTLYSFRSALLLSSRAPIGPVTVVGEVPVGIVSERLTVGGQDRSTDAAVGLGNPYLGVEALYSGGVFTLGLRYPLSRYPRADLGNRPQITSDPNAALFTLGPERASYAFRPYVTTVTATAGTNAKLSRTLRLRIHGGPAYSWGERPSAGGPSTNLGVIATGNLDLEMAQATLTAGFSGLYDPDKGSLRYIDEVRLNGLIGAVLRPITVGDASLQPGVLVHVPILGFSIPDATVGFSLDVPLR